MAFISVDVSFKKLMHLNDASKREERKSSENPGESSNIATICVIGITTLLFLLKDS